MTPDDVRRWVLIQKHLNQIERALRSSAVMTPDDVRRWRKARGLTQNNLAALLGISRSAYIYLEKGDPRRKDKSLTIPRMAELAFRGLDVWMKESPFYEGRADDLPANEITEGPAMNRDDVRIVLCDHCCGEGCDFETVEVYEHGCGFSHRDTLPKGPCSACGGTCYVAIEVEPIELPDLDLIAA